MPFPEWFPDKFGPHTRELYADEERQTGKQVASLLEWLGPPSPRPVLDLCCGWGRHAIPLAREGHRVVGLDGCRYFLDQLNRERPASLKGSLSTVLGDMRALPFQDRSFSAAAHLYTSFGYGTDPADDLRVLRELARVLAPGGRYLLDLINWTVARRAFDGTYEQEFPSFDVVEDCRIHHGTDLLTVKRALLFRDGRPAHIYSFEIRMFEESKLKSLLEKAGFRVLEVWGGFEGRAYRRHRSYRMIMVSRKGEAR